MLGKTHLAAGIAAGAAICLTQGLEVVPGAVCLAGAGVGSLIPDIDQKNSTINKVTKPVGNVVHALAGHRTIFHDPVLYAALAIVLLRLEWAVYMVPVLVGVSSHLLLDALNPGGIPLFSALHGPKIHLLCIRTGSGMDHFLRFLFTAAGRLILVVWLAKTIFHII